MHVDPQDSEKQHRSLVPLLLQNGFSNMLDEILGNIVMQNRDTIHDAIDDIIARRQSRSGKGRKSAAAGGPRKSSAPAYTLKDPKVVPSSVEIKKDAYTARVTRSVIEPILERVNSSKKFGSLYNDAVAECKAAVETIVAACKAEKKKFFDPSFYVDKRSVMYPEGSPADCTVGEPKMAKRVTELFPGVPLLEGVGVQSDDIRQGGVGDCFLIGAICATAANNPKGIERLFAAYSVEYGVYGVVFYKAGGWEWVIVDDFVAVTKGRSGNMYPLFATSSGMELWPCILEKAYAKMHYNWDSIDGGWAREAIVDMTGGADYTLDLYRDDKNMTFKQFQKIVVDDWTILGCAVGDHVESDDSATGSAGEEGALFGLFKGHQYGVLDAKETSDGTGFIKVRNPWGACEWTGPYSDGAPEWKKNPQHLKELNPTFGDDGDFWMKWEDFKQFMTSVDVVRSYPDDYNILTCYALGQSEMNDQCTFIVQVYDPSSGDAEVDFTFIASQDDPKIKYDSSNHFKQKSTPYGVLRMSALKVKKTPLTADQAANLGEGRKVVVEKRKRNVILEKKLGHGLYSISVTLQPVAQEPTVGVYFRVIGPPNANYSMWPVGKEQQKLTIGNCVDPHSVEAAIATPRDSTTPIGATATTFGSPLTGSTSVVIVPTLQNMPSVITPATSASGAAAQQQQQQQLIDTLRRELDEANSYGKHLQEQYRKQMEQLDNANRQLQEAQQQIRSLTSSGGASGRQSFADPSAALGSSSSSNPWDLAGLAKREWEEMVGETFQIAAEASRVDPKRGISANDAMYGVRTLVTAGFGLDELMEDHPLLRRSRTSNQPISSQEFAAFAAETLKQWGFKRAGTVAARPTMNSEEL